MIDSSFQTVSSVTSNGYAIPDHFNWFSFGGSLAESFLLLFIVFLLVYGVWFSTSPFLNYPSLIDNVMGQAILILTMTLWMLTYRFQYLPSYILYQQNLIYDDFSLKISIILVISTILCLLLGRDYIKLEKMNLFEYVIFILLSCLGGCWLIASYDFFTMYLAIELLSLPLYGLAALKSRSLLSTEAGLKYFILGAFSSGVFLFGVSLIYLATGSLNFTEIGQLFAGVNADWFTPGSTMWDQTPAGGSSSTSFTAAYFIGMIFVMVGLLFKLAAAPFHMWSPDVYEGAPTPVTAYFAIVPKLAVFAITIRVFYVTFFEMSLEWQKIIGLCAIGSMIIGTLGAMVQKLDLKRLIAYSAIGNAGYMLLGVGAGNIEGIQGLLLYAFIYIVMTFNAFATILTLRSKKSIAESTSYAIFNWERDHTSQKALFYNSAQAAKGDHSPSLLGEGQGFAKNYDTSAWVQQSLVPRQNTILTQNSLGSLKGILQFRTLSKTSPLLAITVAFMMFSIAGVPPLAGFIGKFYLFFAATHSGIYLSVFVAIIVNVIGAFYYIRCVKLAYFDGSKEWVNFYAIGKELSLILGMTIFFISFYWLYPSTLILWSQNASLVL